MARLLALALVLFPLEAIACFGGYYFNKEVAERSEVILRGRAVRYELINRKIVGHERPISVAKIRIEVDRIYRGEAGDEINALLENSPKGLPKDLDHFNGWVGGGSSDLVIGLVRKNPQLSSDGAWFSKFPKIVQDVCSRVFAVSPSELKRLEIDVNDLD